ncbi:hypothetical protein [Streptosporangium sp. NPDC051022]|uniref:ATP-grasp domain-containing protein n=1 Tax=Streptosporangium sp. NPDC051022 TaxID=3155752 RepID=UPI00343B45BB
MTRTEALPDGTPVLLVGWRPASARALARYGCSVTCVVAPKDAAKARASEAVARCVTVPAPENVEDCLAGLARRSLSPADFSRICSGSEFTVTCASVLGGPGRSPISPATAVALRDKFVQKNHVRDAGLPVASCRVVDDLAALERDLPDGGVVVKPLAGAGAKHTFHLCDRDELAKRIAELGPGRTRGLWLVEEYVPGHEYQIDGIVRDGVVTTLAVSRYRQNLIEIHTGGLVSSISLPPAGHPRLYDRALRLAGEALRAIGHSDGVFHLEAFDQPEQLVFGECAGRVSGGMTDRAIQEMFGVDLHDGWARAVLNLPASSDPVRPCRAVYGEVYLPCPPGRLVAMPSASETTERPGVVTVRLNVSVGQYMPDMAVASDIRAGTALVTGADEAEVHERITDLAAWFRASCEVG